MSLRLRTCRSFGRQIPQNVFDPLCSIRLRGNGIGVGRSGNEWIRCSRVAGQSSVGQSSVGWGRGLHLGMFAPPMVALPAVGRVAVLCHKTLTVTVPLASPAELWHHKVEGNDQSD